MKQIRRIKGTQDILPEQATNWQKLEHTVRSKMDLFNFEEIRTPVFELTDLFARGIGELTDIVSKEMYTFKDRSEKSVTLKPEMTAPVMRAYLENKLQNKTPISKLYYMAPLFRQENPQAGRLRQFHQFGAEFIGTASAEADAEIITLAISTFKALGLENLTLKINSVGDPASRAPYKVLLQNYLKEKIAEPSEAVSKRIEENPLRVLDSKDPDLQEIILHAPKLIDHLNADSARHYERVKSILNNNGIAYEEDPSLVRGLDYYTHTVFEVISSGLGAQNAICGGGRYDLLAEEISGKQVPAVGFAAGMERILMVLEAQNTLFAPPPKLDIFIISLGSDAVLEAQKWTQLLRDLGFKVDSDFLSRSMKAQFREANRQQAAYVLILGETELEKQIFSIKNMETGAQEDVAFDALIPYMEKMK